MDDALPKLWYWQDVLFKGPPVEVELDMGPVPRVRVTPDHALVLHNVTSADTGVYQCLKFSFLLDVIESTVDQVVGNVSAWRSYHNSSLMPLNTYLQNVEDGLQFSVATEWETWGPCVACNRPKGERRCVGRCRVKQHIQQNIIRSFDPEARKQHVMKKVTELSCHSKLLADLFPKVSIATRTVPEFILTEPCVGDCRVDVRNQRKRKGKEPYYKQRHVLMPGARLTLICPEATLKDVVTWRKDNIVIMSNATQHIIVDMFSILHLADVTQVSEGNYTCFVGNTRMQETIVYIAPAPNSRMEGKCVVLLQQCILMVQLAVSKPFFNINTIAI
ncbi:hypothetical protein B7P43_G00434 [Cryptotermes secundus]|uniref:Ig-like domain-containing protein n=1 Tax=Cryptotermes secundus TaxID=105785 RepID=A0A2J7R8K4_9NEOP|nr:hypothetical protein B7P43_G00434 [Cryptotermes secundus]